MKEKFGQEPRFVKDKDNLLMLQEALRSKNIDKDIKPILEKFFTLPITPHQSCYGHPEKDKSPYLSYVEDEARNEKDKRFQQLLKEKILELTKIINGKIGGEVVNIALEEVDHGGRGPKDYTLKFDVIDKKFFKENGKEILDIIWQEFSKYLDKAARELIK
ncbi:MAG: hypothetical protein PHC97_01575 [Patescibacteria group bacterium]|nr:hypothetical protein [Patescibacteria group bacterium]